MPQGNAFRSSSRSQMGSNVNTVINQGGGNKKAGFPYQVGRSYSTSIAFQMTDPVNGHCCKLSSFAVNVFPLAHISRPIGSTYSPNSYFKTY